MIYPPAGSKPLCKKPGHINYLFSGITWFVFVMCIMIAICVSVDISIQYEFEDLPGNPVVPILLVIVLMTILGLPLMIIWSKRFFRTFRYPSEPITYDEKDDVIYFYKNNKYVPISPSRIIGWDDKKDYVKFHYDGGRQKGIRAIFNEMLGLLTIRYKGSNGIEKISVYVDELCDTEKKIYSLSNPYKDEQANHKSAGHRINSIRPAWLIMSIVTILGCCLVFGLFLTFDIEDFEEGYRSSFPIVQVILYPSLMVCSVIPLITYIAGMLRQRKIPYDVIFTDESTVYGFENGKYTVIPKSNISNINAVHDNMRTVDRIINKGSSAEITIYKTLTLPSGKIVIHYSDANGKKKKYAVSVKNLDECEYAIRR